jgi:hypothetical protein
MRSPGELPRRARCGRIEPRVVTRSPIHRIDQHHRHLAPRPHAKASAALALDDEKPLLRQATALLTVQMARQQKRGLPTLGIEAEDTATVDRETDVPSVQRFLAAQHRLARRRDNVGQRRSHDDADTTAMGYSRQIHLSARRSRRRYTDRHFAARRTTQSGSGGLSSALGFAAGRVDELPRHL